MELNKLHDSNIYTTQCNDHKHHNTRTDQCEHTTAAAVVSLCNNDTKAADNSLCSSPTHCILYFEVFCGLNVPIKLKCSYFTSSAAATPTWCQRESSSLVCDISTLWSNCKSERIGGLRTTPLFNSCFVKVPTASDL